MIILIPIMLMLIVACTTVETKIVVVTATPEPSVEKAVEENVEEVVDLSDMIEIPGGEFTWGYDQKFVYKVCLYSGKSNTDCLKYSTISQITNTRIVSVPTFYIDKYEVTIIKYKKCVNDGACQEIPLLDNSKDNYPITNVQMPHAYTYCQYQNKRLPNDLEWEKAYRGQSKFPFGDSIDSMDGNICDINCEYDWAYTDYNDGYIGLAPVGSFKPNPYGLYDMFGNASEITSSQTEKGFSYLHNPLKHFITNSTKLVKGKSHNGLGFRCAK